MRQEPSEGMVAGALSTGDAVRLSLENAKWPLASLTTPRSLDGWSPDGENVGRLVVSIKDAVDRDLSLADGVGTW